MKNKKIDNHKNFSLKIELPFQISRARHQLEQNLSIFSMKLTVNKAYKVNLFTYLCMKEKSTLFNNIKISQ